MGTLQSIQLWAEENGLRADISPEANEHDGITYNHVLTITGFETADEGKLMEHLETLPGYKWDPKTIDDAYAQEEQKEVEASDEEGREAAPKAA